MDTFVCTIDQPVATELALQHLAANHAIVAPTDTVYGVMCRFDQPKAIDQLYAIKNRPPAKAIPVLIGEPTQLEQVTRLPISTIAQTLIQAFWPGPLTLVVPALPTLPTVLTANQPTVGVRLPNHPWLRALIRQSGPLAATSANLSGQQEARTTTEVLAQLQGRVELVISDSTLDQQAQTQVIASTVVAIDTQQGVQILRPGPIAAQIQQLLQERFGLLC